LNDGFNIETKKWLDIWERAGDALAEIKKEEIRSPDYYENNRAFLNAMLSYSRRDTEMPTTTGLVEWQRLIKNIQDTSEDNQ